IKSTGKVDFHENSKRYLKSSAATFFCTSQPPLVQPRQIAHFFIQLLQEASSFCAYKKNYCSRMIPKYPETATPFPVGNL
ncbi:MAG: hypothetical protein D3910_19060, partial [Candidatus Electrothrix sp. ATG2]|nr:hypothetical protein [Candidatus Electrothrix sp. ATG2]